MKIDIVSVFPEYFEVMNLSLMGKAQAKGLLEIKAHNLRDWTHDVHHSVDDTPVGGGAGMAPMRSHIFHLFKTEKIRTPVTFWYGARSKREIFYEEQFEEIEKEFPNFKFHIALSEPKEEDNWKGYVSSIR